jgi:hypothetical protein
MAGIPTIKDTDYTFDELRGFWKFLLGRIMTEPTAAAFLADVTAFGIEWKAADDMETQLQDAVDYADALATTKDVLIDAFGGKLHTLIHGSNKVDTTDPTHVLFFGSQTLTEHRRPRLGAQLLVQSEWPTKLAGSTVQAFKDLAAESTALVADAKAAEKGLATAKAALATFRNGGARSQVFATFNALCAKTFGGLKALAHTTPGLAAGWAESFFRRTPTETVTAAEATAAAERAQAKADKVKKQADELAAKKAAKAAKAAAAKQKAEEIKALEAAAKAAQKAASDAKKKKKK